MHLVGFYNKNISRCTALWISKYRLKLQFTVFKMLLNANYKLLKNNNSFCCLQLCSCQLVCCCTNMYCVMIGTGSCLVNCTVCLVCVRCTITWQGTSHLGDETETANLQIKPTWCTFLLSMFISFLYMFWATMCRSSGETTVSMGHLVCVTVWMNVWSWYVYQTNHPHRVISTKCRIDTVVSSDDGHTVARNM